MWVPNREINESVDDWHHNADVVYYVEHDGAYTGVGWKIEDLTFSHLPAATLADLYPMLEATQVAYESRNPRQTFQLYSYNALMDWLAAAGEIEERRGGATLVFLNMPRLAAAPYTFYGEPQEDLHALRATAPAEVQYPGMSATDPSYQRAADVMNAALAGGLTQPKMLAALELVCPGTTTAAELGVTIPGATDSQSLCEQWRLEPIPNLLGNKMRRYFVSDNTRELARFAAGDHRRERGRRSGSEQCLRALPLRRAATLDQGEQRLLRGVRAARAGGRPALRRDRQLHPEQAGR